MIVFMDEFLFQLTVRSFLDKKRSKNQKIHFVDF
jgi:hypothetical protein